MLKRWNFLKTGFYEGINLEKQKAENEALVESGAADPVRDKLKEDRAYQNAMANSDAQNTKIEYDRALERAMVDLLDEGHTDLFQRYSDDPDFRERLDKHLAPREAGDTPAPPEPAPTATIEPLDWEYIERPLAAKRHTFAPSDDMRNDIVLTGKLFENRLWVKRDDGKMAGAYYPPSDVRYESLDEAQKAAEQHYREWVASGEPIPPVQQYAGGGAFGGGRKLSIDEMVKADEQNAKAKTAEAKKAARRVTARAKRERERPAKLAARWAEPSEQSQSDLDKNLAKLRSIDESDFPTGEKDRIVAVWEKAVAEADDDAPKTKREKRETVPRPDPTPDRATAEQIAHIKALYAVHPDSYGEVEGPPSTAAALVNEADTTMGQSEARDGIRRLTDVLKHHPPFGPPNDLRREEVQAAIEKLNELVEDPANRRLKEHYERLLKDDRRVREHLRLYFSQGPSSIKEISAGFKDLNLPQQARASKRHLEAKVEPEPAPAEEQAFMLPSFVTAQYRKPEEKPKREKPKPESTDAERPWGWNKG